MPTPPYLEIWLTGGGGYTDYTSWVDGSQSPMVQRTHPVNQPMEIDFYLTDGIIGFTAPDIGNRVKVVLSTYANFFTGYITALNKKEVIGANPSGAPIYRYSYHAVDETLALEWGASAILPTYPPFLNLTQGAIVKQMIAALGSSIDTTNIDAGILIPFFRVKPDEGFWDAVRRLSDRTNFALWVSAGYAYYKRFDSLPFDYAASEDDSYFDPTGLVIQPPANPVYNDVFITGQPEPQAYVREYFIGDGFNGTFPLKFQVFGATSSLLQQDDFTAAAIDLSRWTPTNPDNMLSESASLLFVGGPSSNNNRLTALAGLEIAGTLNLRAGKIMFNAPTSCLIGCVMQNDTGLIADVIAGFAATKQVATTRLQAVVNGAKVGPYYDILSGKTYQFVLTLTTQEHTRRNRAFFSLQNIYGGENVVATVTATFTVTEIDDSLDTASPSPVDVLSYAATLSPAPQFAWYTLLSGPSNGSDNVNLNLNFCLLQTAIAAELATWKPTDSGYVVRKLGGDAADPNAWACLVDATSGNGTQLEFIVNPINTSNSYTPVAGEKIRVSYRAAGTSRAHVRSGNSVTAEIAKSGGNGIKSTTLPALNPPPRNSIDLERACQAFIDDHTTTIYAGTWTFGTIAALQDATFQADTFQNDTFQIAAATALADPLPGRFMLVNCPTRYPAFQAYVNKVQVSVLSVDANGLENIQVVVTFGQLLRYDEIQPTQPPAEALTGQFDKVAAFLPTDFTVIGDIFSRGLPNASFDGNLTATTIELDAGAGADASFELRTVDAGWGSGSQIGYIGSSTDEVFTVPRVAGDTTVFIKNIDSAGRVSRYPAVVRVVYPAIPPTPTGSIDASNPLSPVISLGGNDSSVASVEIRASDNSTVLYSAAVATSADLTFPISADQVNNTFYCYYVNAIGEYSPAFIPAISVWMSSHVSYRPLSNPLTATDAGASATINISPFTMRSGLTDVNVNSSSISSLSYGTLYYVYYDDKTFAGGAVNFNASTVKEVALAAGNRYFIGSILTPRSGSIDTIGNNDGGSGTQSGLLETYFWSNSPSPWDGLTISGFQFIGTGAADNQDGATDQDVTTFSTLRADEPSGGTASLLLLGFGPSKIISAKSITLKVRAGTANTGSATTGRCELGWYVLGSGPGSGPETFFFDDVAGGTINRSIAIYSVSLPLGVNLALLAVKAQSVAGSGANGGRNALTFHEAWVEVQV